MFPSHPDDPIQLPDEEKDLEEELSEAHALEDEQADNWDKSGDR